VAPEKDGTERFFESAPRRAWRDLHLISFESLFGFAFLLLCAGGGAFAFHQCRWIGGLGEYMVGPLAGAFTGVLVILLLSLLLTFRTQRDDLRGEVKRLSKLQEKAGSGPHPRIKTIAEEGTTVEAQHWPDGVVEVKATRSDAG